MNLKVITLLVLTLAGPLMAAAAGDVHSSDICAGFESGNVAGDNLLVIVNKDNENKLQRSWAPKDLVYFKNDKSDMISPAAKGVPQALRKEAYNAVIAMFEAAKREGHTLYVHSSYRSYEDQCLTFRSKISKWSGKFGKEAGLDYARKSSAEPGRSQHQLGTTLDITVASVKNSSGVPTFSFEMTRAKEYIWLQENAHRFGYVLSYPWADDDHDKLGYNNRTRYYYEPWHWRYIGVEAATDFYERNRQASTSGANIVLDEYLSRLLR
ncbi:MAG TPA: M15 family metallopeptidase [Bdellovibrio sp.]|nr:M15 family metallopeptidase [Bdellovibrio sp.]